MRQTDRRGKDGVTADRPDLIVLDFVVLDEVTGWQFLHLLPGHDHPSHWLL